MTPMRSPSDRRLDVVVGDVKGGDAAQGLQRVEQLTAQLVADLGVKVADRLVEQEHRRGSATRVRPSAVRCFWPPEISCGSTLQQVVDASAGLRDTRSTLRGDGVLGVTSRLARRGLAMFSNTVRFG